MAELAARQASTKPAGILAAAGGSVIGRSASRSMVPSAGLLRQSSTPAAINAIVSTTATTKSPRRSRSGRTRLGRRLTDCGGQDSLVVRGAPDSRERTC